MEEGEIIFVYNVDSSLFAVVRDYVHKLFLPRSYSCNVCRLTFGALVMKKEWREFLKKLPHKTTFLHRDEFHKSYPQYRDALLPAVFLKDGHSLSLVIGAQEINLQRTLDDLIILAQHRLIVQK